MPILAEQERLPSVDTNKINDPTQYGVTSTGMATVKDYGNLTLGSAGILLIKFDGSPGPGGVNSSYHTWLRVKVGTTYVGSLDLPYTAPTWTTYGLAVWLAAGTYDIKVEGMIANAGDDGAIENFQAGISGFNDQQGTSVRTYSTGIALTVANRNTPVGALMNATYLVQVYALTAGAATNLENVGDNLTNGVAISFDAVQQNWDELIQGEASGAMGASGKAAQSLAVGSSHTITITKRNAATAVTISMIACPWILPAQAETHVPVNIYFSQGSTLYCMLEPWFLNPSKFVGVGTVHSITWGAADDFYSSLSGVDLLNFSYMMDIVDILNNNLIAWGLGGCIGVIAVDAR